MRLNRPDLIFENRALKGSLVQLLEYLPFDFLYNSTPDGSETNT